MQIEDLEETVVNDVEGLEEDEDESAEVTKKTKIKMFE